MGIDHLIKVIKTERIIRNLRNELSDSLQIRNIEDIEMVVEETSEKYQDFVRLISYGLMNGYEFDILNCADSSDIQNVELLEENFNFLTYHGSSGIKFRYNKGKTIETTNRFENTNIDTILCDTFSGSFGSLDNGELLESIRKHLDNYGEIKVNLVSYSKKISKGKKRQRANDIVKKLSHGKGENYLHYALSEYGLIIKKKSENISIDLAVYEKYNIIPGEFDPKSDSLPLVSDQISQKDMSTIHKEIGSNNLTESEALLLSKLALHNTHCDYIELYLSQAGESPEAYSLRDIYNRQFKERESTPQTMHARRDELYKQVQVL